ncbi:Mitochondrial intermediate peptidase [Allomyces javanicus]|nr:Mitochondrial intermediate peptidase [Allomyces javanicus]
MPHRPCHAALLRAVRAKAGHANSLLLGPHRRLTMASSSLPASATAVALPVFHHRPARTPPPLRLPGAFSPRRIPCTPRSLHTSGLDSAAATELPPVTAPAHATLAAHVKGPGSIFVPPALDRRHTPELLHSVHFGRVKLADAGAHFEYVRSPTALSSANGAPHATLRRRRTLASTAVTLEAPEVAAATGLLGDPALATPASMVESARAMIAEANRIVDDLIARAATASADPDAITNATDAVRDAHIVIDEFDALSNYLCQMTDTAEFVRNVHPDPAFVEAADTVYADLSSLLHTLNTNQLLYTVLKRHVDAAKAVTAAANSAPAGSAPAPALSTLELRNAAVFLRDFEHSGIHLPAEARAQHVALADAINDHARDFFSCAFPPLALPFADNQVQGLDPTFLNRYVHERNGRVSLTPDGRRILVVDADACNHILYNAHNEHLREMAYDALHAPFPDQEQNLGALLATRHALATLVGAPSFAHLFLQDKMLQSPHHVLAFLDRVAAEFAPALDASLGAMEQIKGAPLQEWDKLYYSRQLPEATATGKLDARHVQHLPRIGTAMAVFAELVRALYGIDLVIDQAQPGEVWQTDVIRVTAHYQGQDLGTIYCDLYDRHPPKLANAAHFTVRGRRIPLGSRPSTETRDLHATLAMAPAVGTQKPVVVLAMNLRKGAAMPWTAIETLWHELGHAMHSLLAFTHFQNISGTRCALDFSEVPSILMEQFLPHTLVQQRFQHHQPGCVPCTTAPHPPEAFRHHPHMISRAVVNRDLDLLGQISLAAMDQVLHSPLIAAHAPHTLVATMRADPGALPLLAPFPNLCRLLARLPWNQDWAPHLRLQHLATYSAGYYTYLWSRLVAYRIFQARFADANDLSEWREPGMRLWREVLGWGGGRDPWACVAGVLGEEQAAALREYVRA